MSIVEQPQARPGSPPAVHPQPLHVVPVATPPPELPDALVGVSRSRAFIPELESLRGIAVMLVLSFHVDGYVVFGVYGPPSMLNSFVRAGHTGVDLFFLLSGFLLALPFLKEGLGGKRVSLRIYFARRALRILPLYYTAVLVGTVLSATRLTDLRHALPYLGFLNAIAGAFTHLHPYSDVWWSLTTEAEFYLLLPLLPLFLATRTGRVAGAGFLTLYALAYAAMVRGLFHMDTIDGQLAMLNSVFGRGPLFLCGIAAAFVYHTRGTRIRDALAENRWLRLGGADALLAGVVVALAALLAWVVSIGPARQMGAADQPWHIVTGALWAAFLLLVLLAPLHSRRLVCNAVLARLGILSYSIYLLHAPFMHFGLNAARHLTHWNQLIGWHPASVLVMTLLVLACCGLASLTYRFIERPFLVRKAQFDAS